jgi:uncharacterized membrane protein YozB (DUF420 family)
MSGMVAALPDLNAALNAAAFVLVSAGLIAIKRGAERLHQVLMLSAVAVSAAFLTSYLIYHYQVGSVRYQGTGAMRALYLAILVSHIVLAVVQVPLILATVVLAYRNRARHRRLAKITAPIWLYVSITGVIVYAMLYLG